MTLKQFAAKIFASLVVRQTNAWAAKPVATQKAVLATLLKQAQNTQFGKDHDFKAIKTHQDFIERVPIRDYEDLKGYVKKAVSGASDILWPGRHLILPRPQAPLLGSSIFQ